MKFIISLLLTALFAYALGLYLDWWSIAIAAFIVAILIPQRPLHAFISGGTGIALLWSSYSLLLNQRNNGLLASKIANILPLHGNIPLLISVTAFTGGLVGAFAALNGSLLRRLFAPKKVVITRNVNTAVDRVQPANEAL